MKDHQIAVLDLAGTTIQDDGLVVAAFTAAMANRGIGQDDPRFAAMRDYVIATMGQSKIAVFTHLLDGDTQEAHRANLAFEQAYAEMLEKGLVYPIPGAERVIAGLQARGIKVALTTGFSPATRDALLAAVGWTKLADLALSPADVGRGRPYPDLVLGALLRLGGTAVNTVITVGDTVADIGSGLAAGAGTVVGVETGAHRAGQLFTAGAHQVIPTIADLPDVLTVHDSRTFANSH